MAWHLSVYGSFGGKLTYTNRVETRFHVATKHAKTRVLAALIHSLRTHLGSCMEKCVVGWSQKEETEKEGGGLAVGGLVGVAVSWVNLPRTNSIRDCGWKCEFE